MKLHANARTCPNSRRLLVRRIEEEGWALTPAAEAAGVSERTARKWLARWRAEGEAGLLDRSSAPRRMPDAPPADRFEAIEALRRLRMTAAEIAEVLGMALSTVSRWLKRIGLGRRGALAPPEPPNRYERKRPGELIHVDIKKLGRISVEGRGTASRRPPRASHSATPAAAAGAPAGSSSTSASTTPPAWPTSRCCPTRRAPPRQASCAGRSPGSPRWASRSSGCSPTTAPATALGCTRRPARARNPPPLHPPLPAPHQRQGRAIHPDADEPLGLRRDLRISAERTAALAGWLAHYNFKRRHGSLGHKPPAARLAELEQPRE